MFVKKLQLMTVDAAVQTISRAERYELIAMIAEKYSASVGAKENEDAHLWDSNDIDLNFEEIVYRIN